MLKSRRPFVCLSHLPSQQPPPPRMHAWAAQARGVTILYDAGASFHGKIDAEENGNTQMT